MDSNYTTVSTEGNSTGPKYFDNDPIPWGRVSTLIAVLIFGTLANLSIIYIVLRNKRLRTRPNALVVNLAVGDLLRLNVNLPFILYFQLHGHSDWPFGEAWCKIIICSLVASGCVTVFSLMALAIERYLAIACPWRNRESNRCMRYSRKCCLFPTAMILLSIWFAAFAVGAPFLKEASTDPDGDEMVCKPINHGGVSSQRYKIYRVLAAYILPLVTIVVAHALTAYTLLKSIREPMTSTVHSLRGHGQNNRVRSRKKLAFVISALSIMFFVGWLPFYIFDIWFEFFFDYIPNSNAFMVFFHWKDVPIYVLSCFNPVVLYIISTRFREHLIKDCFCCAGEWGAFTSLKPTMTQTTIRAARSMLSRQSSPTGRDRRTAPANELSRL